MGRSFPQGINLSFDIKELLLEPQTGGRRTERRAASVLSPLLSALLRCGAEADSVRTATNTRIQVRIKPFIYFMI